MNKITLDELKIKKLCDKYGFKYKVNQSNNTVLITSNFDKWIIEVNEKYLELKHYNKNRNDKGKCHYHKQKKNTFWDWEFLIRSIYTYKPKYHTLKKINRINELFKQIHN